MATKLLRSDQGRTSMRSSLPIVNTAHIKPKSRRHGERVPLALRCLSMSFSAPHCSDDRPGIPAAAVAGSTGGASRSRPAGRPAARTCAYEFNSRRTPRFGWRLGTADSRSPWCPSRRILITSPHPTQIRAHECQDGNEPARDDSAPCRCCPQTLTSCSTLCAAGSNASNSGI